MMKTDQKYDRQLGIDELLEFVLGDLTHTTHFLSRLRSL